MVSHGGSLVGNHGGCVAGWVEEPWVGEYLKHTLITDMDIAAVVS